jgi:hypothetical protein
MEGKMRRKSTGILLAILPFLFGCIAPAGATSVAVQTPTPVAQSPAPMPRVPSATPDAVLLRVQGEVHLQQFITRQVVSAAFGDYLWWGDVIVAGQDARAEDYEVVVSKLDGELWRATVQETELPYPEAQPALEAGVLYEARRLAQEQDNRLVPRV